MLEGGGYDVVLVETVGVGQSETTVAGMVDSFLLLGLARSGDQLQGIKKGVLEIADVLAINKADGDRVTEAKGAARELERRAAAGRRRWPGGEPAGRHPCSPAPGQEGDRRGEGVGTVLQHRDPLGRRGPGLKRPSGASN